MGFLFQHPLEQLDHPLEPTSIYLQEVVLQALSPAAYGLATRDSHRLFVWLSSRVLSQGDVFTLTPGVQFSVDRTGIANPQDAAAETTGYLVKFTEPVKRGYLKEGITLLSVVAPDCNQSLGAVDPAEEDSLEIDESFLGNALVVPASRGRVSPEARQYSLFPDVCSRLDDECTIYVSPYELSRIGALEGDWVLVGLRGEREQRLVRLQVNLSSSAPSGSVYATPTLVHNIAQPSATPATPEIAIHPTPFGSSVAPIPLAKTITVARVSSPISTDRCYQESCLRALHQYFLRRRRLVKQGDIVTLALNTDDVRRVPISSQIDESAQHPEDADIAQLHDVMDNPDELVYFKITNIEHDIPSDLSLDAFCGSQLGEWGCWVEHTHTRIIQTGVEQSRIPASQSLAGHAHYAETASFKKLRALIAAALTQGAADYRLQLSVLLEGARGSGKMSTIRAIAAQLGLHVLEVNCYRLIGENDIQTEGTIRARFERAASCAPCILVLRHVDALSQTTQPSEAGKELLFANVIMDCTESLQQAWNLSGYPTVVVATTDYPDDTPPKLVSCFKHQIRFSAPDETERDSVLRTLLTDISLAPDVSLNALAVQTAALVPSDLADLVSRSERVYLSRAAPASSFDALALYAAGANLNANDLEAALTKARTSYSESIGAPKIPNVTWDDVGGLAHVKADILDTIQLPLEHPELFAGGMKKRSGILLYGPPGTGKTLLAKAVATSCALNFFSVKGPELLNMYIGESEANVRRVFQRARDAKPCVIFFDELDSVAPKRGNHGDSGGVMDRIVSQLLAELDGIAGGESGADVFVIGATNRPDLLDPALLRPGRFDRMLYLGVSQTHDGQLNILQALTRKFKLHPDLRLEDVAQSCPFNYTGADFYALCSDALLKAMSRKAEELDAKIARLNEEGLVDAIHPRPLTPQYYLAEMASREDIEVLVTQADFEEALRNLVPSVSQAEMEHYRRVQQQFSKETINSDV